MEDVVKNAMRMGMELGMQIHTLPQFQALYDRHFS